jgi:hypothetical protein
MERKISGVGTRKEIVEMIALLPLIFLIFRLKQFLKLTLAELPKLSAAELDTMKRFSKIALVVFGFFTVVSFVPYALFVVGLPAANWWSAGITVLGLVLAGVFDFRAERIKKRGAEKVTSQKEDRTRWYHVVVSIILPCVGLPWGIVNLCRSRRKSGLTMVITSSIVLLISFLPILLAPHK